MSRVLVGMSGGVDSSVVALLLKEKGYEVVGVTINLWEKNEAKTEKASILVDAINDARAVADKLGIEYHVVNFRDVFKEKVIDYFANEYMMGRTPNPCNACNRFVKFEALLFEALNTFNCEYIATGHYSKIGYNKETNRYFLRKADTDKKDQTYALYNLTQEQLKHTLMPLGEYTKEEVREIAEKNGLINAKKQDSQEICFVEDNDYAGFICTNYDYVPKKGNFVDLEGNILGEHSGVIYYTIGQRKGLTLSFGKRMYVVDINVEKNEVVLGEDKDLFSDTLICDDVNFMAIDKLEKEEEYVVKIRYAATPSPAILIPLEDSRIKIVFKTPQRAITRGQAAVFYDGDVVVGGGTIV